MNIIIIVIGGIEKKNVHCMCYPSPVVGEHTSPVSGDTELSSPNQNSTDEEKLMSTSLTNAASDLLQPEFSLTNRYIVMKLIRN